LDLVDQGADMGWRTSPEHETVSKVLESWLNGRVHQSLKDGIYDQAGELWREELGLLLSIASAAVG
jgi:hypothetical protein